MGASQIETKLTPETLVTFTFAPPTLSDLMRCGIPTHLVQRLLTAMDANSEITRCWWGDWGARKLNNSSREAAEATLDRSLTALLAPYFNEAEIPRIVQAAPYHPRDVEVIVQPHHPREVIIQPRTSVAILVDREALAQRVAEAFTSAFTKLEEHKADIEALWVEFGKLGAGENIMGCTSKAEFCETVLHRSYRAVRYLLTGGNPVSKRRPVAITAPTPAPAEADEPETAPRPFAQASGADHGEDTLNNLHYPIQYQAQSEVLQLMRQSVPRLQRIRTKDADPEFWREVWELATAMLELSNRM